MVRSGRQRARGVRLAARRPGPGWVPALARSPAGLRQWWRRIDWGRAGTITAVVAALAGLLLTGVSTLYDALVSGGVLVINPFVRAACQDAEQKGLPVEAREVVEEAPDNAVSRGSWSQYRECGGGNLRRIVPGGQVAARMPAPRLTSQARRGR